MQNKTKCCYCIRENNHPMVMELDMLTKDALQEAIRLDNSKQRYSKGISLRSEETGDFNQFAN